MRHPVADRVAFVGLDLSWKRPAYCVSFSDDDPSDWARVWAAARAFSDPTSDPVDHGCRLGDIAEFICLAIGNLAADPSVSRIVVAVEQSAFIESAHGNQLVETAGAVKLAVYDRFTLGITAFAQASVRKTFLGKLPGKNDVVNGKRIPLPVAVHAALRAAGFPHVGSDEGDAFVVANHARSVAGYPAVVVEDWKDHAVREMLAAKPRGRPRGGSR